MTRRLVRGRSRVLLSDSSDEEDDNAGVVVKHVVAEGNVAAPSLVAPPGIESMLIEDDVEDDDISVEEDCPPVTIFPLAESFTPVRSFPPDLNMSGFDGGGSPLLLLLRRRGINVLPAWIDSFVREMEGSLPGFRTFGVEKQGELALAHLLIADFNEIGAGCLPNSFESLHAIELAGPFVLQVDEITDIGAPLRERYHERGACISRCLKLSMTDGVQRVVGIEYQPIPALRNLFPAGLKICVRNVFLRRGVFLLSCESVEVLGGLVQRLEEARLRAVHEVNKPARGSRRLRGQTGDRTLSERATAEAWLRNTGGVNPAEAAPIPPYTPRGHSVPPVQATAASIFQSFATEEQPARGGQAAHVPETDANVGHALHASQAETRFNVSIQQKTPDVSSVTRTETRSNVAIHQVTTPVGPTRTETRSNVAVHQVTTPVGPTRTENLLITTAQQATPGVGSTVQSFEVKRRQTTIPWVQKSVNDLGLQENAPTNSSPGSRITQQRVVEQNTTRDSFAEPSAAGIRPLDLESDEDDDEDYFESMQSPFSNHITPTVSEEPFTYLALLKEKLSAEPTRNVQFGKIKCVLTGVKDFQYKDCDEFALIVHIDDGSLVTEALIHHDVVQKMVGFSPKEVNSALAKSNTPESREMKSNMKRFQAFLKKFEGSIHVQYEQSLSMPVISHMVEGIAENDLSALQNRVGRDTSEHRVPRPIPEFIDVSP